MERLTEYYQYCGNQHTARRLLNDQKLDPMISKELSRIEQNPRLNKLTLTDILVKPMHRITRYPLLFKRLLSTLPQGESFEVLKSMVESIEEKVGAVNDIVRVNESSHRIKLIDENMDFGSFEVNPHRSLINSSGLEYQIIVES